MPAVVGRERELAAIAEFLDAVGAGPCALLIEGDAGIGKTTLWAAGVEQAEARSLRVLSSRPVEAEARLSFAGLIDLFGDTVAELAPELPAPQRHALEIALLLRAPTSVPTTSPAVGTAVLGALRLMAEAQPLVVAIDDAQWLDPESGTALAFALRRLGDARVAVIVARRSGGNGRLAPALERPPLASRLVELPIGPLSLGALHRLLRVQLGAPLPRPLLREIERASGGNPFFALEIGRALTRRDAPLRPGEPLPVPATLDGLVRERLAELAPAAQRALAAAAALRDPTVALVEAAVDAGGRGIDEAVAAGVLTTAGERLRFTHPLLGGGAYGLLGPQAMKRLHARLAAIVGEPEERARHLALATDAADARVADELEEAAAAAEARGARESAAALAEHAVRLTPPGLGEARRRRLVAAAEHQLAAGDPARGRAILEGLVRELPPGQARADVLWRLSDAVGEDLGTPIALCEQALREAGDDPGLRARIALSLSPRTVEGHLTQIYAKLRVRSRAELAHRLVHAQSQGVSRVSA